MRVSSRLLLWMEQFGGQMGEKPRYSFRTEKLYPAVRLEHGRLRYWKDDCEPKPEAEYLGHRYPSPLVADQMHRPPLRIIGSHLLVRGFPQAHI